MSEPTLAVTATINLRGLRVGEHALVDPRDPYISELLSASFLIAREQETSDPDPAPLLIEAAELPGLEEPAPPADALPSP